MADIKTTSLVSAANEVQVRLFLFGTTFTMVCLVISIVVSVPTYSRAFVWVLSWVALGVFFVALFWPLMRPWLENRVSRIADSLALLATSGWAWFALVLAIGITTTGLAVYNRTTLPEPPVLVGLRHIDTRIASTHADLPYGLQVVIQTDKKIPTAVAVVCDGPIGGADFRIVAGGFVSGTSNEVSAEYPNIYLIRTKQPDFLPENPIIVTLYSREAIKVTRLETR